MEYAGFWRRSVAMSIDGILLGVVQAVLTIGLIGSLTTAENGEEGAIGVVIVLNLLVLVIIWLYFSLMESSKIQGTLGKMLVGIVVTDVGGNRISFGRASGRYFGKFVSGVILMIGYLMAAFTERKQALHDIMAGCLVIRKPS